MERWDLMDPMDPLAAVADTTRAPPSPAHWEETEGTGDNCLPALDFCSHTSAPAAGEQGGGGEAKLLQAILQARGGAEETLEQPFSS